MEIFSKSLFLSFSDRSLSFLKFDVLGLFGFLSALTDGIFLYELFALIALPTFVTVLPTLIGTFEIKVSLEVHFYTVVFGLIKKDKYEISKLKPKIFYKFGNTDILLFIL